MELGSRNRLITAVVAFFPLFSLFTAMSLLGGGASEGAPPPAAEPAGGPPIFFVGVLVSLIALKITAIVANFRFKYFGWVYHVLELYLVIFLVGLFVVISTFSQSWDIPGAIKLVLTFLLVVANLYLKDAWLKNTIRCEFKVAQHTHADLHG